MYSFEKLSFCIKAEEKGIAQYIDLEKSWEEIFNTNKITVQFFLFFLFFLRTYIFFIVFFFR